MKVVRCLIANKDQTVLWNKLKEEVSRHVEHIYTPCKRHIFEVHLIQYLLAQYHAHKIRFISHLVPGDP